MILIGKIVNTHGIKGELRILSDFDHKDKVFKKGFKLYIGSKKIEKEISTYRKHKQYDMVLFTNVSNINEVLSYKGLDVYVKRDDLKLGATEYLSQDLIHCQIVEQGKIIGEVDELIKNKTGLILKIKANKNFMIPFHQHFIKKVNIDNKTIETERASDLIL